MLCDHILKTELQAILFDFFKIQGICQFWVFLCRGSYGVSVVSLGMVCRRAPEAPDLLGTMSPLTVW